MKDNTLVAIIRKTAVEGFFGFITTDESAYQELIKTVHGDMSLHDYGLAERARIQTNNGVYIFVTQILDLDSLKKNKKNKLRGDLTALGYKPRCLKLNYEKGQTIYALETECVELMYNTMLKKNKKT